MSTEAAEEEAEAPTREQLLAELALVGDRLAKVPDLYTKRDKLYLQLRALDPPVTQREIAAAARTSEQAVTQSLRKLRNTEAPAPTAEGG